MIVTDLSDKLEFRTHDLKGCHDDNWLWPKEDQGAYKGPIQDWNKSHYDAYFKNVKQKKVIVTAGANMGLYVRAYANMFDAVYAFEPHYLNFYCMSYNCPYPNVYKFRAGLGEDTYFSVIKEQTQRNMGTYKLQERERGYLPVMTIDSFDLPHCDIIQLDTEGYEGKILKGATKTIEKFKPVIVIENNHKEAAEEVGKHNYKLQEKSVSDYIYYFDK